jgi:hypothetical protein
MPTDFASALQSDDAEARMRQSLGLTAPSGVGAVASSPGDSLKRARQVIRSQTAAQEYAERQLAHTEATNQDLWGKLHDARRDKDAAVAAAQSAVAEQRKAERVLVATEAALAAEKAVHARADRTLAEAQATIRDLQARLNVADQGCQAAKADLAAERQARQKAENALRDALADQASTAPTDSNAPAATDDRGGGGRPRKKVTARQSRYRRYLPQRLRQPERASRRRPASQASPRDRCAYGAPLIRSPFNGGSMAGSPVKNEARSAGARACLDPQQHRRSEIVRMAAHPR